MGYQRQGFEDEVTVLTAEHLENIEDAIIDNEREAAVGSRYWNENESVTCAGLTITRYGHVVKLDGSTANGDVYVKLDGELIADTVLNNITALPKTRIFASGSEYLFSLQKQKTSTNGSYSPLPPSSTPSIQSPYVMTLYVYTSNSKKDVLYARDNEGTFSGESIVYAPLPDPDREYMIFLQIKSGWSFNNFLVDVLTNNIDDGGCYTAVDYQHDQTLTTNQKTRARNNIGAAAAADIPNAVVYDQAQNLTDEQKNTVRVNINAADADEVTDLKSTITQLDGKHILELVWNYGFIKPSTLSISSGGSTHVYSDVVFIKAGTMLYLPRVNKSTSTTLLAQCSQDGTPKNVLLQGVSTGNSTGEHIMYPIIEDTYVRFGGNKTMSEYMIYYAEDFNYDIVFDNSNYALFNSRITLDYADGGIFEGGVNTAVGFKRSNIICLPKGMTIEFYGCGSGETGIVTVSRYDAVTGAYVSAISYASSSIQHKKYTATDHMYIRLCARIAPNTSDYNVVLPEDCFYGWKIYYEPNHYKSVMNHALYGKALTAMGDSLIYGNKLGPGGTWITNLGIKYNMTYTNLGDNGNPVARVAGSSETAMVDRTDTIPLGTEYFILEGGSNDKNYKVPLGDADSTDVETFNGALNTILSAVRARIPKAKILLMTSYQRFKSVNNVGLGDEDYANAIISAGKRHCVPVYDNFHNCGLTFWNDSLVAWIDEARNRQKLVDGAVTYYQNVQHFSIEAYKWLTGIYEHVIAGL